MPPSVSSLIQWAYNVTQSPEPVGVVCVAGCLCLLLHERRMVYDNSQTHHVCVCGVCVEENGTEWDPKGHNRTRTENEEQCCMM